MFETHDKSVVEYTLCKTLENLNFTNLKLFKDEDDEAQFLKFRADQDSLQIEAEIFTHPDGLVIELTKLEGDFVMFKEQVSAFRSSLAC